LDQDEFDPGSYYGNVLNNWAMADTSDAWSAAGTYKGNSLAYAEANAGGSYGTYSGAFASNFVTAYEFYMPTGGDLTISIDYFLDASIESDGPGFAKAGAGAILGVFQGDNSGIQNQWLHLPDDYDMLAAEDPFTGTLTLTLSGLGEKSWFRIFAGTAAYAFAYEQGNTEPVPEPATLMLLGIGLVGIAGFGRKRLIKR
jgi:hypothetical protein